MRSSISASRWQWLGATAGLLMLVAASVDAQVIRGPYLQQASDSEVTIRWRTSVASESTVVYGTEPGIFPLSVSDATLVSEHSAALSSLLPATRYYYAVTIGGSVVAGGDLETFFETSPVPGTVSATRIWVVGDSGTANLNAAAVYNAYRGLAGSLYTDLWLMLGDNAYPNGTDPEYQAAVFDLYPELLAQTPLWPTLGNHDGNSADSATESGPYYDIFTLPRAGEVGGIMSGTEAYYSFNYANIHFVVLESHETDRSTTGAMHVWLEADLQDAVAQGATDWLIAFWHHPPYSKGSHDSDLETQLIEMRTNFLPLLETYGADLVLTGHSHAYERSFLLDGHYGLSSTIAGHIVDAGDGRPAGTGAYEKSTPDHGANEGAVYAVAGSSGQTSGGSLDHPAMFISLNELGSMVLDVNGAQLDATFIDHAGTIRDSFRIQKGPAPETSSIAGRVWLDADADGLREGGEADLSGIAVALKQGSGVPVATTTTNGSGAYGFSGLNAGEYRVDVEPVTRIFTAPAKGSDPTIDSDFSGKTGSALRTLAEGEAVTGLDAGLLDAFALGGPTIDLSDIAVEPYPALDAPGGTAESRAGGTTYYTLGTRWIQTLATYDIDPSTVISFEFRSATPGAPSAIGFDDDENPITGIRLFELGSSGATFAHPIPQEYVAAGGWQTYQIPVGQYFTGTGLHLVLGVTTPILSSIYVYIQDQPVAIDGVPTATTYTGTHDAELREANPGTNFDLGTGDPDPEFTVDQDDPSASGNEAQVVLRFDGIFGAAAWQIPLGANVTDALLFIDIDDIGNDLELFELTTGFGAETAVTWNSMSAGIDPVTETTNAPITVNGLGDKEFIDVLATLQAWSAGTTNHGWAFLSTGTGGVDFDASENLDPADRPALIVRTVTAGISAETEIRNIQVPEPSAWLGLATGWGWLALMARRRRGARAATATLASLALLLGGAAGDASAHSEPDAQIAAVTQSIALAQDSQERARQITRRGRLRLTGHHFEEARADFGHAAELTPGNAPAQYHAAEALLGLGRFDEALLRVGRFRAMVGGNDVARTRGLRLRARIHAAAGNQAEASRDWERFIAQAEVSSPDDFIAWSKSLEASPRAALAALQTGIERLGPLASLERRAYALEMKAGLYAEASERAARWWRESEGNVFLLRYLAEACEQAGREDDARAAWRQVIEKTRAIPPHRRSRAIAALQADAGRAIADRAVEEVREAASTFAPARPYEGN